MRSAEEIQQNAVIHARLEQLKAQATQEVERLRAGHASKDLQKQAARFLSEVTWAHQWSAEISKPKSDSFWAWVGGLAGVAWTAYHWWSMLKDDFLQRRFAWGTASILPPLAMHLYNRWRNRRAYENLLPWLMMGDILSLPEWLSLRPLQPA
jgi:hypothetical protein